MATAPNIGDRVKVDCEEGWYKGEVVKLRSRGTATVRVKFDDGDLLWVSPEVVRIIKKAQTKVEVMPAAETGQGKAVTKFQPKLTSIKNAQDFLSELSPEQYITLMAAANSAKSTKVTKGQVLLAAFPDGSIGYGVAVGGGQTLKVWRVGDNLRTSWAVSWNCVRIVDERVATDRKGWPTQETAEHMRMKYTSDADKLNNGDVAGSCCPINCNAPHCGSENCRSREREMHRLTIESATHPNTKKGARASAEANAIFEELKACCGKK